MMFSFSLFFQIHWYREGGVDPKFRNLIYANTVIIHLFCISAIVYFVHGCQQLFFRMQWVGVCCTFRFGSSWKSALLPVASVGTVCTLFDNVKVHFLNVLLAAGRGWGIVFFWTATCHSCFFPVSESTAIETKRLSTHLGAPCVKVHPSQFRVRSNVLFLASGTLRFL